RSSAAAAEPANTPARQGTRINLASRREFHMAVRSSPGKRKDFGTGTNRCDNHLPATVPPPDRPVNQQSRVSLPRVRPDPFVRGRLPRQPELVPRQDELLDPPPLLALAGDILDAAL